MQRWNVQFQPKPTRYLFAPRWSCKMALRGDVVFVLGAGVDRVLGLPLVNTLFRELSDFASGSGAAINKAIRSHAKHIPLDLQTYAGDQAENLGHKLLGSDPELLPKILAALDRHQDAAHDRIKAIKTVMKKLEKMP